MKIILHIIYGIILILFLRIFLKTINYVDWCCLSQTSICQRECKTFRWFHHVIFLYFNFENRNLLPNSSKWIKYIFIYNFKKYNFCKQLPKNGKHRLYGMIGNGDFDECCLLAQRNIASWQYSGIKEIKNIDVAEKGMESL